MAKLELYTWNVNGIRAISKKGFLEWFLVTQPDVLCVQEIKADDEKMSQWWNDNKSADVEDGFFGLNQSEEKVEYFADYDCFWHACTIKKGYSGTAIFYKKSKFANIKIQTGIGDQKFDEEGRTTILETQDFVLINSYYPQGGRDGRIPYKIEFYNQIIDITKKYQTNGQKVILCGDLNTTREDIDLARPKENRKTTGCLPEERQVLEDLINCNLMDGFRYFYPQKTDSYTYWDQITRARDRNVGWRIDYFLVDLALLPGLQDCQQLDQVLGSDHCPVKIVLEV